MPAAPLNVMVDPLVPLCVHTPEAVNVTGLPEPPPVADTVNGASVVNLFASAPNEMVCVPCAIVMETALLPLWPARLPLLQLNALTVTLNVPACVGIPELWPVEVLKFNPVGNVPVNE